jgi:hypothetical protein
VTISKHHIGAMRGWAKKKKGKENRKNRIIRVGRTGNETLGADHEHPALHYKNNKGHKKWETRMVCYV